MTFRAYDTINYSPDRLAMLGQIARIIEEHEKSGLAMSVRQLYYQLVTMNVVPNRKESYNKVQALVNDGRMTGHISWTSIEDRTRNLQGLDHFITPQAALKHLAKQYRRDLWADQQWRPEVWVEKDALVGVVGDICMKLRVDFFSQRGYNSSSEQWRAGQRFANYVRKGQRPIVLHLGDHDPSGIHMTESNREKLSLFAGTPVIVQRLALNMGQIEELHLPPNPAKDTDPRGRVYYDTYGSESWELDALPTKYIQDLILRSIIKVRDEAVWGQSVIREEEEKRYLKELSEK